MSKSNHTLRFDRTYKEATGKTISSKDFMDQTPRASARQALLWLFVVACTGIVGYIFIPY